MKQHFNTDREQYLAEILPDTYRNTADLVAASCIENPQLLAYIIEACNWASAPFPMRASRVFTILSDNAPGLIIQNQNAIFALLLQTTDQSVLRNVLRSLATSKCLPKEEALFNDLLNLSLNLVENAKMAIAVRAFAIKYARILVKTYPELNAELDALLELLPLDYSPALKSVASKKEKK
jgi:hypothetical protein